MKLLVQSDDFGITPGVAQGIVEAIRNGIVRNTGLFANMPWAEQCVEMIRPYLDRISFGIDLNISAGSPLLDMKTVPGLVQKNGSFLTSAMNRALDTEENHYDHVNYEEVYAEFDAQIKQFEKITGKLPDYIHGHAYGTPTTTKAMKAIAEKYDRVMSTEMLMAPGVHGCDFSYYRFGNEMNNQFRDDIKEYILEDRGHLLDAEYSWIGSHCGYIDLPLFDLSSYTIYRIKDLEAMTSPEVKDWVERNHVELITYRELKQAVLKGLTEMNFPENIGG